MKYQVQGRRLGTPQAQWRVLTRREPFDAEADAQQWIDAQPVRADDPHPWEYHITPVPE